MTVWTFDEAVPVVAAINTAVRPHGFKAQMVGSVADHGSSEKDLDVLVVPVGVVTLGDVVCAIGAIERLYRLRQFVDDILGFVDGAGRPIEVWLGNVPAAVWQSDEYQSRVAPLVTLSERQLELLREIAAETV